MFLTPRGRRGAGMWFATRLAMRDPGTWDEAAARADVHGFLRRTRFMSHGAVFTDLDGTAVHEIDGRVIIPPIVEYGLKRVHDSGRRVVINTMRFPQSVLAAFAAEWYRITGEAIPLVSLNGSQIGHVAAGPDGVLVFDELDAFPLAKDEIAELLQGVQGAVTQGAQDLLVFFYPRDWRVGELLWTPDPSRVAATAAQYRSASEVFSGPVQALADRMAAGPVCLVLLPGGAPQDRRMAYQRTERTCFVTHAGVDKRHGAIEMARHLGIDLAHSVGAGDAQTDTFLSAVGLAAIVGNTELDFKGRVATLRLPDPLAWGQVLFELGGGAAS